MAKQTINIGTPNGNNGDFVRDAFDKVNDNFTELYNRTPVQNVYADMATMYADQGNQLDQFILEVTDASAHPDVPNGTAFFKYKGTIVGDETDYELLTSNRQLESVNPLDSSLGSRLQSIEASNGFFVRSSTNGFNGYAVNLTGSGNAAYAGIDLINQSGTFTDATTLMHYSSGYTEVPLRNNGGLFFTNDMYFTGNRNTSKMIFQLGNQAVSSNTQSLQDNVLELLANREVNFPSLTTTIIDAESTGRTAVTREWIENQNFSSTEPTGFEALNEGNGIGWRLIGRNTANYGNIGLNSIDASYNNSTSSTAGATGNYSAIFGGTGTGEGANEHRDESNYSLTVGSSNQNSGDFSLIGGINCVNSGGNSIVFGNSIVNSGIRNVILNTGFSTGDDSFIFSTGDACDNNGDGAILLGKDNRNDATNSIMIGRRLESASFAEIILGSFNTNIVPSSEISWDTSDRLITIGNGNNDASRSDALIILKNGTITAPSLTELLIDGATDDVLVTKGWVNAQGFGSGSVDDTAYGVSWNGVTGVAPSKNVVYDKIESLVVGAGVGATPLKAVLAASATNHNFGITIPDSALLYYGATGGGGLVLLEEGVDYTKAGSVVTFLGTITPIQANDVLILNPNVSNESLREILGYGLSASNGVPVDGTAEVDRVVGAFTCTDVRISLRSADTSATVTVDVHKNGVSIFDTLVTIDATEKTSVTATTPFVFTASASSISFADDDEIEFIISGTPTDATGLKVKLIGTRN